MKHQWYKEIQGFFRGQILVDEPLWKHTSYKIGGPADLYLMPADSEDLAALLGYSNDNGIPRFIIGNGSNILVGDRGFRGVVIDLKRTCSEIKREDEIIIAGSGVELKRFLDFSSANELGGLEFLAGIPGTVGGALRTNAGAFEGQIFDKLISLRIMDTNGNPKVIQREAIDYGYRKGLDCKGCAIIEALFQMDRKKRQESERQRREYLARRRQKQPLSFPSAGSVFKRPPGHFAGKLIEEAGCKGLRIGGAEVSEKHANFIINVSQATAQDVLRLIEEVRERVLKAFSVELELEIQLVGDF